MFRSHASYQRANNVTERNRIIRELLLRLRVRGSSHISKLQNEINQGVSWTLWSLKKSGCAINDNGFWSLTDNGIDLEKDCRTISMDQNVAGFGGLLTMSQRSIRTPVNTSQVKSLPGKQAIWLNLSDLVTITESTGSKEISVSEVRAQDRDMYNWITKMHLRFKKEKMYGKDS